ncbi:accessory Sec system glycosylation chaperone GtfB, partial [Staphylococcus gallinarum]
EIMGALNKAFEYELLIMGYNDIAHNHVLTAKANLFNKQSVGSEFIPTLLKITQDKATFDKHLTTQKEHANEVNKHYFNQQLLKR